MFTKSFRIKRSMNQIFRIKVWLMSVETVKKQITDFFVSFHCLIKRNKFMETQRRERLLQRLV